MDLTRIFFLLAALVCVKSISSKEDNIFQPRIVGGSIAGTYPWFSLLGIEMKFDEGTSICGGSLIKPDVILTAAHCWDPDTMSSIRAIVNFRSSPLSGDEVTRDVVEMYPHPKWSRKTFRNDLLLLKLDSPVTTHEIVTISFQPIKVGNKVKAIGYGITSERGSISNELNEVTIPVVDMNDCNDKDSYAGSLDPLVQFCASAPGKDSCQGDSGGAVLNSEGHQVGIVSSGIGCARTNYPGVYTRISGFEEWIHETLCQISNYAIVECSSPAPTKRPSKHPTPTPTSAPILRRHRTEAPFSDSNIQGTRTPRTQPPRSYASRLIARPGREPPKPRFRPPRVGRGK